MNSIWFLNTVILCAFTAHAVDRDDVAVVPEMSLFNEMPEYEHERSSQQQEPQEQQQQETTQTSLASSPHFSSFQDSARAAAISRAVELARRVSADGFTVDAVVIVNSPELGSDGKPQPTTPPIVLVSPKTSPTVTSRTALDDELSH